MILSNWKKINSCIPFGSSSSIPGSVTLTALSNVSKTFNLAGNTSPILALRPIELVDDTSNISTCYARDSASNYQAVNIICGSGNTQPTVDDYCLESPLALSCISIGYTPLKDENNNYIGKQLTKTWQNNTGSSVTVNEIGALLNVSTTAGTASNQILIERTVLETPVTVANGDSITLALKILV